jgi:Ran GTPase-activating protein (RanGAP) involved in mRNA processing and transport
LLPSRNQHTFWGVIKPAPPWLIRSSPIGLVVDHVKIDLHIYIYNTIGDEGATALANALKVNTAVQDLWLGGNTIGDEGATVLANALTQNSTLQRLRLDGNTIGDEGAKALLDCIKGTSPLEELWKSLSNISFGRDDGMVVLNACIEALEKSLKYNTTLTTLVLFRNTNISRALLDEIDSLLSDEILEKRRQEKALRVQLLTGG